MEDTEKLKLHSVIVSFKCNLCECSFLNIEEFLAHKNNDHFVDWLTIRSIVFEEKSIEHQDNQDHSQFQTSGKNRSGDSQYATKKLQLKNYRCDSILSPRIRIKECNTSVAIADDLDTNIVPSFCIPLTRENIDTPTIQQFTNPFVCLRRLTNNELKTASNWSRIKASFIETAAAEVSGKQNEQCFRGGSNSDSVEVKYEYKDQTENITSLEITNQSVDLDRDNSCFNSNTNEPKYNVPNPRLGVEDKKNSPITDPFDSIHSDAEITQTNTISIATQTEEDVNSDSDSFQPDPPKSQPECISIATQTEQEMQINPQETLSKYEYFDKDGYKRKKLPCELDCVDPHGNKYKCPLMYVQKIDLQRHQESKHGIVFEKRKARKKK